MLIKLFKKNFAVFALVDDGQHGETSTFLESLSKKLKSMKETERSALPVSTQERVSKVVFRAQF